MDSNQDTTNIISPVVKNELKDGNQKKSPWFTPCRRIGLKRKFTTPTSRRNDLLSPSSSRIDTLNNSSPTKKSNIVFVNNVHSSINYAEHSPTKKSEVPESLPTPVNMKRCNTQNLVLNEDRRQGESQPEFTEDNLNTLKKRVKDLEDRVNELKTAQLKEGKHEIDTLTLLITKWRGGCQEALQLLLDTTTSQGFKYTMSDLLQQLQIPHSLVRYNPDLEEFIQ